MENVRRIYLSSPPNYKQPKRNDLTVTPIQDVVVVVVWGGVVDLFLSFETLGPLAVRASFQMQHSWH